jgi:CRP/FNR family transcriptional regulator
MFSSAECPAHLKVLFSSVPKKAVAQEIYLKIMSFFHLLLRYNICQTNFTSQRRKIVMLRDFAFTHLLGQDDMAYLQAHARKIALPKESVLFYQNDVCNDILFLSKGEIELYMYAENEKKIPLYTVKSGEQCVINTSSTLSQTPAIGTAQTLSDIEGWLVSQEAVKNLMQRSPAYLDYLFSLFTIKLDALATLIQDIKFKKLDSRVLEWLRAQNDPLVQSTHEEIAEALGSSRVVISRVLKDLEKQQYIRLHRKAIEIL